MSRRNRLSNPLSAVKSVLRMRRETGEAVERMKEAAKEPFPAPGGGEASTLGTRKTSVTDKHYLAGARLGYSLSGKKIHVLNELSVRHNSFLCGARRDRTKVLFFFRNSLPMSKVCSNCDRLAQRSLNKSK